MALTTGTRLGVFQLIDLIGRGGMGEVYRATDTSLGRQVAIKVLPEAFAQDAERLARFEREAKTLASLNHPNIAAIHAIEKSGGITALVMELVEGDDLSQRIARGAIPIDEALPIAKQIAEALEAAHEQGIIHRDLKPANIKVRADGTVKVLDFGLAKAMEPAAGSSPSMSMAPTITTPALMTGVGMILGTAAYMSPEQARGKTVDKRADIWAFGAVLYEMLTGTRAFEGEDIADTLSNVMKVEPSWQRVPASIPARVLQVMRACLQKNPKQRMDSAQGVRLALEGAFETAAPATSTAAPVASRTRERVAWTALGLMSLAALALTAFVSLGRAPADVRQMRFLLSPPDGWRVTTSVGPTGASPAPVAVSPDGSRVAFLATGPNGSSRLWVRALDTLTAQELPGTDGAASPFWSPDSRFLGFFADGKLKKIDVSGGPAVTLCATPEFRGGTWSRDGIIVFSSTSSSALQRVSASGGVPSAATALEDGDPAHVRPSFLPDGEHFVYRVQGGPNDGIYVGSLDAPARTLLIKDPDSSNVLYAGGRLLFLREQTLMAQPFDLDRLALTGEPVPIAEQVVTSTSSPPNGVFSGSDNGVLAYQTGTGVGGSQLVWFDRAGKQLGVLGEAAAYSDVELSPDGTQVSVSLPGQGGPTDIWLYDVTRGIKNRFTFDPADDRVPIWSPDGRRAVFSSRRKGQLDLYQKSADGSGAEEVLLEDNQTKYPMSWSADGTSLLYSSTGGPTSIDLFVLPLSGDRTPFPFVNTPFAEASGAFSPDGRWVAYTSNESGRNEVYVAPFPGSGGKRQVSTAGGGFPRWRRDGTEIFYLDLERKLVSAAVNGRGASFEVGVVKPLFETRVTVPRYEYAVAADGQRFLINTESEQAGATPITVVTNWTTGLNP